MSAIPRPRRTPAALPAPRALLAPPAPIASLAIGALLAGCTVGPDYVAPELDLPDVWFHAATDGVEEGESNVHRWWEGLEDPVLNDLIERTVAGNLDLQAAFERIRQSRAVRGVATGERFPDFDGVGEVNRNRLSEDTTPVIFGRERTDTISGANVRGTWEIDVWGRITRSIESADAGLQASVEDYRDILVLLLADVGSTYVDVRALQARIASLESNVQTQRDTLELTRDRTESGLVPQLDVHQAELNLTNTESNLPSLRQALTRAIHRLGVLTGEHPTSLYDVLGENAPIPGVPDTLMVGIPAELLRQRPDIRRAERQLAARTADIGVATAALYPLFTLNGSIGLEAYGNLLESGNRTWSFGPAFVWNLFDGGRVRNTIALRDAQADEALVVYEQTVLLALEDVENALVAYVEEQARRDLLQRSVTAAQQSVEQVQTLYRAGLTDFQNVLDTERSLFQQQDQLAESEGLVVRNLIQLYRALGGGWDPDPEPLEEELVDQEENGEPIF